ncbi:MAG: HAD-IIA family hydrolase [Sphaerobacter sp.]|nr:HAD-IIA family hydrolase [Sphaerobacter sp.]
MEQVRKSVLTDMDGVLVRGRTVIPGAREFIEHLIAENRPFLVLTNNSMYPPAILAHRLSRMGLDIPPERIHTSALATAQFLASQRPRGTAYVVGEEGLYEALEDIGYTFTDRSPDYVVLGETQDYSFERITRAIRLIQGGARFIATNPDVSGPSEEGIVPATGAVAALIERAIGATPYFIGKPNPLMIRTALRRLGEHSQDTIMIGDRMDTDILTGIESGLETVLVLSGVTTREMVDQFPYQPTRIVDSVADLL